MRESLKNRIAKLLAKYYPYSQEDIYNQLKKYDSIDLVMNGMNDSLEYGISLERSCYESYLTFKRN